MLGGKGRPAPLRTLCVRGVRAGVARAPCPGSSSSPCTAEASLAPRAAEILGTRKDDFDFDS